MLFNPSQSLFGKLLLVFSVFIGVIGAGFALLFAQQTDSLFQETNQRLHYQLAEYLVEEKFSEQEPFTPQGQVNKALFGDIMHDMMAVNRNIEVYLLDSLGEVKYCVALDGFKMEEHVLHVELEPIKKFIAALNSNEVTYVLGDNPRDDVSGSKQIFSAASFSSNGHSGYIYIILAGENFIATKDHLMAKRMAILSPIVLFSSFFLAILIGGLLIWYLTKNIRKIVQVMWRFEQGDYQARVQLKSSGELTYMADQFNRMADTILQNIGKIKAQEKLRQELMANVSHDLRTPLAIVYGYVETFQLKEEALTVSEKRKFIQHIMSNLNKLKHLISEIFDLSKLEAREITLNSHPIYINELIYDTIESNRVMAEQKNISISTNITYEQALGMVMADPNLIDRVLQNLLDNAIRFTPAGGEIALNAFQNGDKIALVVEDGGVGIKPKEIPLIFDRYYTKHISDKKQGTGLGLAIAKHIVELHESAFKVKSEVNQGTSFSFELPVFNC